MTSTIHKAKSLLLIIAVLAILPSVFTQTWVLTWSDEFNGPSLDTSKWTYQVGKSQVNQELEYYTNSPQNSFIKDGKLVIQALQQSYNGAQYTSARISTQNKFSTKYGKFEISAILPYGQGIWPAFWMLGNNINQVGWPACGEIDIMEFVGKDPTQVFGSLHMKGADFSSPDTNKGGFSSSYHTYSVDWQPNYINFYVDDVLYESRTPSGSWPFNQNFYIILNLAVGGTWPGNPNSSTKFPQQFTIDYVRVYEKCFSNCNKDNLDNENDENGNLSFL